jgi:nucleoside-diphosphate-sugar epimerase
MKSILITGASGCIGHYLADLLIKETDHELFFLVRNPQKIKFDYNARPNITILQGDLREIEQFSDFLLKRINVAILAATAWGGAGESYDINVLKTLALINLLNPKICEQIIYFSTASILDNNNQLLKAAGLLGTDYIRTKHHCFTQLSRLSLAKKITAVFPTLVFGGDTDKPYSHLSAGLPEVLKWIDLIRWFKADGSCHFIHAKDIALTIKYLIDNIPEEQVNAEGKIEPIKKIILGNQKITVEEAIGEICAELNKRIYFQIPLPIWLANLFIKIFKIQMDEWSRFALSYRHFIHKNPVNPNTLGMTSEYPTLKDIIKNIA